MTKFAPRFAPDPTFDSSSISGERAEFDVRRGVNGCPSAAGKVSNRKKKDIEVDLEAQGFDRMPKADGAGNKKAAAKDIENEDDDDEEPATATASGSYEYLLSMAIQSLTEEKVRILESNVYCFQKVLVSFFVAQVSDDVYMVCNVVVDVGA